MNDQKPLEFDIRRFEPTLREMSYKVTESVLITLIISFTKLKDTASAEDKPGLIITVDMLLKLLESHRDSK